MTRVLILLHTGYCLPPKYTPDPCTRCKVLTVADEYVNNRWRKVIAPSQFHLLALFLSYLTDPQSVLFPIFLS